MDESTVSTYAGEVASLVAPRFRHEPVCVCREGFAGDKCEVMLNKCALQPCPTFKVCIPDTSAQEYSCHCPEGMAGPSDSPNRLTMVAVGRTKSVDPKGQSRMARMWFSNCEHGQASMV